MSEELELYPLLSMLAEVGGFLGLFLGLSFLNLVSKARDWVRDWAQGVVLGRRRDSEVERERKLRVKVYTMAN